MVVRRGEDEMNWCDTLKPECQRASRGAGLASMAAAAIVAGRTETGRTEHAANDGATEP